MIDTIVIGAGVGGLSAANYEAKKGKKVLVLEQRAEVGGKASPKYSENLVMDPGPSIIIMKWVYEQFAQDMGINLSDYIKFSTLDSILSLSYNDKVYQIPSGKSEFEKYISEYFPNDVAGFKWMFEACKPVEKNLKKTVYNQTYNHIGDILNLPIKLSPKTLELLLPFKKNVEKHFSSPEIKGFLYDFPNYAGLSWESSNPTPWFILYSMITEGVFYPTGGIHQIPFAYKKLAQEQGVAINLNEHVEKIDRKDSKYIVTTTKNVYTCSNLIANIDPILTERMLGIQAKKAKSSYSYCTITYSYETCKAPHHLLHIPSNYDEVYGSIYSHQIENLDNFIFYLNHPHVTDSTTDKYLFSVAPISTELSKSKWDDLITKYDRYITDYIHKTGIATGLKRIDYQTPAIFESRDGNPKGSLFGSGYDWFGLLPQPLTNQRHQGIVHCGQAVQPGAGLPMVTLSGKFASESLQ